MRRAMGASEARSPAGTKAAPPPLRLPAAAGSSGGVKDSQCARTGSQGASKKC
jgi:hypothetical protein